MKETSLILGSLLALAICLSLLPTSTAYAITHTYSWQQAKTDQVPPIIKLNPAGDEILITNVPKSLSDDDSLGWHFAKVGKNCTGEFILQGTGGVLFGVGAKKTAIIDVPLWYTQYGDSITSGSGDNPQTIMLTNNTSCAITVKYFNIA